MSVVAPILNVLSVLLDVLQLSGALLISRHHLLLWLLISHLSVLLAQAEVLFFDSCHISTEIPFCYLSRLFSSFRSLDLWAFV